MSLCLFFLCTDFPFVASSDFRIFETKRSWSDARQTCHENDSSLADLHNFWTIRAALTTASSLGYGDAKKVEFWIGLVHNATTRQYRWSSGSVANRLFLAVRLCDKTPEETFKDDWCYALQRQRNTNSFKLQHKDCKLDMHTNQHFFICHYSDQSLDYQIHELEKTWTEAHLFCKENGSSLALLRTERDIASIHQKISSLGSNSDKIFWIGLVYNSTSSPGFHWSTGETALYEHLNEVYNLEPRDWCHLITKTKLGFACFERVACKQGGGEVDFNSSFICQPKDFGKLYITGCHHLVFPHRVKEYKQFSKSGRTRQQRCNLLVAYTLIRSVCFSVFSLSYIMAGNQTASFC